MHVGIIMDGNGRWAKAQSLPRLNGHNKGADTLISIVKSAPNLHIDILTLYAFSTENWNRPTDEVQALMKLLRSFLSRKHQDLIKDNIRMKVIGDLSRFDRDIRQKIYGIINDTAHCTGVTMILALNYGGRDEIVRTVRRLAKNTDISQLTEQDISSNLDTAGVPDPDFIIRTAGEQRLSNFLLWQSAYTEFVFVDTLWPEFTPTDLAGAVSIFQQRKRNFGGRS